MHFYWTLRGHGTQRQALRTPPQEWTSKDCPLLSGPSRDTRPELRESVTEHVAGRTRRDFADMTHSLWASPPAGSAPGNNTWARGEGAPISPLNPSSQNALPRSSTGERSCASYFMSRVANEHPQVGFVWSACGFTNVNHWPNSKKKKVRLHTKIQIPDYSHTHGDLATRGPRASGARALSDPQRSPPPL